MTTGTTLVEVKQALVTQLTARPGLSGATVSYAYPGRQISGDHIWLGGAPADTTQMTMRGGSTAVIDEDFRLTVFLQSLKSQGEGQEAADLAAVALLRELQQELAETPKVTANVLHAELAGWEHIPGPVGESDTSHGSRFEAVVRVRARLA